MEQTLHDLAGILTKAIPTIIILVLLHQFLKFVLFQEIEKTLKQRGDLTHGARHAADASLANAERKTQEYEARLRDAKMAVYKEQEDTRKKWLADQAQQLESAKSSASARVTAAKQEIASEASAARGTLSQTTAALADQIATTILAGRRA
jgi:F-type H+-transporting ATPase subunit b